MALKLRDKRKIATKQVFCVILIIVTYLSITTAASALNRSSLYLSDQALFPDGDPAASYDELGNYNAQGWKYVSAQTKNDLDTWNSFESPHGGYASSSNKCRVCHALHKANKQSFRLLFNSDRATECDRCHDPVTGLSGKKPYRLLSKFHDTKGKQNFNREDSGKAPEQTKMITDKKGKQHKIIIRNQDNKLMNDFNKAQAKNIDNGANTLLPDPTQVLEAKGEHTIGATAIPDSNIALPQTIHDNGLVCFSCHDPHFSPLNTIRSIKRWKNRGLLKDPGENGGSAEDGMIAVQPYSSINKPIEGPSGNVTEAEVKSAFCGDCHNKNANWDRGNQVPGADEQGERPNNHGHPIGNVDGFVNVYGTLLRVATDWAKDQLQQKGCLGCHAASTETDDKGQYTGESSFPHQSRGHKLLFDDYKYTSPELDSGQFGGYTGDPNRPIPELDRAYDVQTKLGGVCRRCHTNVGLDTALGF